MEVNRQDQSLIVQDDPKEFAVLYDAEADWDLARLFVRIAETISVEDAELYVRAIKEQIASLSLFPRRGEIKEHGPPEVRMIASFDSRYQIVFAIDEGKREVLVLTIWGGGTTPRALKS